MNRFWSFVGLFVAFVFAVTFFNRSAQSDTPASTIRWEYRTETIEPTLLAQRLNEWGGDRWEAFAVERGDTVLEQDGVTKLKVANFQVTARRPLK
ncbi:MAG: hypothetical protein FJ302_05590 [Planctomycetes bacterium]|nr:hypothetical protein [Planctomycetota bacterium]